MLTRKLIAATAFTLTLFVSTTNEEVDASVRNPGDGNIPLLASSTHPFLCDSALAADCFLMFASEHPKENITAIPVTQRPPASAPRSAGCSFVVSYRGDRCRPSDRSDP